MTENHPIHADDGGTRGESQGAVRKPRAIRFSDPEWHEVKKAAERHGVAAAEYVRETILGMARSPEDTGSTAIPGDLAPLIERTFRYTYMLATKMRDDMMAEGHGEEIEKLINSARETQDSLLKKPSK